MSKPNDSGIIGVTTDSMDAWHHNNPTANGTAATLPLSIERCPHCKGYLLEGRFPKGTYIETICRRCNGPDGSTRPRVIIKR